MNKKRICDEKTLLTSRAFFQIRINLQTMMAIILVAECLPTLIDD